MRTPKRRWRSAVLLACVAGMAGVSPTLFRAASRSPQPAPGGTAQVVNVREYGARGDGETDDTEAIAAALAAARKSSHARLYLPAGTYLLSGSRGVRFPVSRDGMEIFGDGIGKTVLRYADNVTLRADVKVFSLQGRNQSLHDLSFVNGANMRDGGGGAGLVVIAVESGAFDPHLFDLDIAGVFGGGNAGGAGITLYQRASQAESVTTLGQDIDAGKRTVAPASMEGIYAGRLLRIGGAAPEFVAVAEVTATTCTANFANDHRANDAVEVPSLGNQYAIVERVCVHDAGQATGFVVNSCKNIFRDCLVRNVGRRSTQHGFYIQGGYNSFHACQAEGVGGFSYHNHIAVTALDASGNRYLGCLSVNPGAQHLVADSVPSDGANPDVPRGQPMNRYTEVIGCIFRRTAGAKSPSTGVGVAIGTGGALLSNCVFEDAAGVVYLALSSNADAFNQSVVGNVFRPLNDSGSSAIGIVAGNNAVVSGNQFFDWRGKGPMVRADGSCLISDNQFSGSAGVCVALNGDNMVVRGNRATLRGGAFTTVLKADARNVEIAGNQVLLSEGATFGNWNAAANVPTGSIHDNTVTGAGLQLVDVPPGLDFANNSLSIRYKAQDDHVVPLDRASGRLLRVARSASPLAGGRTVRLGDSGQAAHLTLKENTFLGFAIADATESQKGILLAGSAPGSVVPGIQTDGAWKAGDIGIASQRVEGTIHDSGGSTPPASGSYVLFLDSGLAAGRARVMVLRTY